MKWLKLILIPQSWIGKLLIGLLTTQFFVFLNGKIVLGVVRSGDAIPITVVFFGAFWTARAVLILCRVIRLKA